MKKYDERETLFSRISLKKGSKEYKEFYNKNRNKKADDDKQRGISFRDNLRKDDRFKNLFFPLTKNNKEYIKTVFDMAERKQVNTKRITMTYPLLQNAKKLILICQGKEKKKVILNAFKKELPISRLLPKIDLILN